MWTEKDNKLVREFRFSDFKEAFTFMTRVAFVAEELKHHPNWVNSWNYVRIELNTHDEGGIITSKDREFAQRVDEFLK
jgi:4a-hydroxytetrahydrobiopterin dehydratase